MQGADGDHAEYDVPQCAAGTPASECTHTITGTWMPVKPKAPSSNVSTRLIASHAHCHVSPRVMQCCFGHSLIHSDCTHMADCCARCPCAGPHVHTRGHVPTPVNDSFDLTTHLQKSDTDLVVWSRYNNDTGKLICRQEPIYGSSKSDSRATSLGERFNEPGYIATPPCLWGSAQDGLEEPPIMDGVTIKVVAVTNNTYGHHGEMALPEVSLAQY